MTTSRQQTKILDAKVLDAKIREGRDRCPQRAAHAKDVQLSYRHRAHIPLPNLASRFGLRAACRRFPLVPRTADHARRMKTHPKEIEFNAEDLVRSVEQFARLLSNPHRNMTEFKKLRISKCSLKRASVLDCGMRLPLSAAIEPNASK